MGGRRLIKRRWSMNSKTLAFEDEGGGTDYTIDAGIVRVDINFVR
jgi:hypothetical protein